MSVHGEFQRVLADLAAFLRGAEDPSCAAVAAQLEACGSAARDDLNGAAERALALCAAPPPPALSRAQNEEFAQRAEHLSAICHALLP